MFTVSARLSFPRAAGAVINNRSVGAKSTDTENRARSVGVVFRFLFTLPVGSV